MLDTRYFPQGLWVSSFPTPVLAEAVLGSDVEDTGEERDRGWVLSFLMEAGSGKTQPVEPQGKGPGPGKGPATAFLGQN